MINNQFFEEFDNRNVRVIAVSKTKSEEAILELYNSGHKCFGENRVQELISKHDNLPKDIEWHMIGHLQKNKVKYIAPFVSMIHAVDSLELLETIDKNAKKNDRIINVLLQIKIAEEESKFGLSFEEARDIIEEFCKDKYPNVKICGLMGMGSFTDDVEKTNKEFAYLHDVYIELKEVYFHRAYYFKELSIGMSNDYKIAIEHGATMIRIGTLIFGNRY